MKYHFRSLVTQGADWGESSIHATESSKIVNCLPSLGSPSNWQNLFLL